MDACSFAVGGDALSDLLGLQAAHGVEFVSGEANFRAQDLCQSCETKQKRACKNQKLTAQIHIKASVVYSDL